VRLHVDWPDRSDRRRREGFFHLYLVRDGQIAEIRRYDDRDSAIEALGETPLTRRHNATRANKNSNRLTRSSWRSEPAISNRSNGWSRTTRRCSRCVLAGDTGAARCSTSANRLARVLPERAAVVRLLIAAGAGSERPSRPGRRGAVALGASSDDADVAEALIDGGADLEAPDGSIGTPLDNAVGYACWHVARLLVARGARVDKLWHAGALGLLDRLDELLYADGLRPTRSPRPLACLRWRQRRSAELLLSRVPI